jgi:hypothetical protein
MWYTDILAPIFGVVTKPLEEWQKRKTLTVELEAKEKDRQHEINMKKADIAKELASKGITVESTWDQRAQEDMKVSWKDEYLLVLFSIPLVGAFIPKYQDAVLQGFKVLENTPQWYILSILGMVAGAWGLRWLISRTKRVKDAS